MKVEVEIGRGGETRALAGWRKWAVGAGALVIMALMMALAILLVLGVTVTIGFVVLVALIIAVPTALMLALMGRVVIRRD